MTEQKPELPEDFVPPDLNKDATDFIWDVSAQLALGKPVKYKPTREEIDKNPLVKWAMEKFPEFFANWKKGDYTRAFMIRYRGQIGGGAGGLAELFKVGYSVANRIPGGKAPRVPRISPLDRIPSADAPQKLKGATKPDETKFTHKVEEQAPSPGAPVGVGEETDGEDMSFDMAVDEAEKKGVVEHDHRKGTEENAKAFAANVAIALERYPGNEEDVALAARINRSMMSTWKKPKGAKAAKITVPVVNFARVLGVDPVSLWEPQIKILGPVLVDAALGRVEIKDERNGTHPKPLKPQNIDDKLTRLLSTRDGVLAAAMIDSLYEKHFR